MILRFRIAGIFNIVIFVSSVFNDSRIGLRRERNINKRLVVENGKAVANPDKSLRRRKIGCPRLFR
jgi:hypothetical protein